MFTAPGSILNLGGQSAHRTRLSWRAAGCAGLGDGGSLGFFIIDAARLLDAGQARSYLLRGCEIFASAGGVNSNREAGTDPTRWLW